MSLELKVGGTYSTVERLVSDNENTNKTMFKTSDDIFIVGRQGAGPKVVFVGANGLSYNKEGHVIGFSEHYQDLAPRKKVFKAD